MMNTTINTIKRGDIYMAEMPMANGKSSRQQGRRPVLIIQNDMGNKYSPVLTVLPITSQQSKRPLPTHVDLNGCGMDKKSIVLCEQPVTIDKSDLYHYIGRCDSETMNKVEKASMIQLGINVNQIIEEQIKEKVTEVSKEKTKLLLIERMNRIKSLVADIEELDEFLLEEPLKSDRFLRSRLRKIKQLENLCEKSGKKLAMYYDEAHYTMKINQLYTRTGLLSIFESVMLQA